MTPTHIVCVVAALSLTSLSTVEAQESSPSLGEASSEEAAPPQPPAREPVDANAPALADVESADVESAAMENAAGENAAGENAAGENAAGENAAGENAAGENAAGEDAAGEDAAGENAAGENAAGENVTEPQAVNPEPANPQVRLRFRSIRLYAGAALQMAPVDAPSAFETRCELPCNVDVEPGSYRLNVLREDGNEYALPTSMRFDGDTRISLKYGASTGSWVGGILALTGILGVLISGGVAIAGAANDNSGQTTAGLVGLGVSSLVFGGGLVTFLLSERGLRAEIIPED